jgi:hypothetical protein
VTDHGELGSLRWCVFTQTRPASMSAAARCARERSVVQTAAPNPYLQSFARDSPSFSVYSSSAVTSSDAHRRTENRLTTTTGPNNSSFHS